MYFASQFVAGNQPDQAGEFNTHWQIPYVRPASRVTSLVWGAALVSEFMFRVVVAYTQPIPRVLVLTPIVFNVISASAMAWTVWRGVRAVRRLRQLLSPPAHVSRSAIERAYAL